MGDYEQLSEADYAAKRIPGKIYVSRAIVRKATDETVRLIRIVSSVIDPSESWQHAKLKNEIVLRITPGVRQQIIAKLYENPKGIFALSIQKFQKNPSENYHFTFLGNEIRLLRDFIESMSFLNFSEKDKARVDFDELRRTKDAFISQVDTATLERLLKNKITESDIVAVGYRKEQLEVFSSLFSSLQYFLEKKQSLNKARDEDVWQWFFEKNPWIFGYGLNFIFNQPLQGRRLESVVKGSDVATSGKRVDALLKTSGAISSLCLVEIKTHNTELLHNVSEAYRSDCWSVSRELAGGISQVQKTTLRTIENLRSKFSPTTDNGDPTGEEVHLFNPKAYLIIGSLSEFKTENGINTEKFSSFELFRKSLHNIEIITFDELYERAKYIVHNNEHSQVEGEELFDPAEFTK